MNENTSVCPACGLRSDNATETVCRSCGATLQRTYEQTQTAVDEPVMENPAGQAPADQLIDTQLSYGKNYFLGALFALVAAIIGAVAWGIVGSFGYIISWIGFFMAVLVSKFYDFSKTRTNMIKFIVVLVCVLIGVTLGELIAWIIVVYKELNGGAYAGFSIGDCIFIFFEAFGEISGEFVADLLLGYLFAILGSLSILKEVRAIGKAVKSAEKINQ